MYCSKCGGQLAPNTAFCNACGAPASVAVTGAAVVKRPGIITLLAVLQLICAAIWLLAALGAMAATFLGSSRGQGAETVLGVLLVGGLGAAQLFCGIGLLKLKPHGRTIQLVFAWIGLIGIPVGTIVSILILVYMYKPGIKALFSGKEFSEFTSEELAQVAAVSQDSAALTVLVAVVVVVVVVAMIGIVAAIAIPGLLRARMSGNEASAMGSLRAINSAQATYASSCAAGGYAVALDDLAKPPNGSGQGFIGPDLGTNGATKSGYTVRLVRDAAVGVTDIGTSAATCNASTRTPASSYFASAEPAVPGSTGIRYFATDTRGIIFSSTSPIANPIVESVTVVPIR